MTSKLQWLELPEEHDYTAAKDYLGLLYHPGQAKRLALMLHDAPMSKFKAKDIFRASALSLLGISNSHVAKNITKIKEGHKLSPILLVRHADNERVLIADGYHRLCAVYQFDEDVEIPCKII